MWKHEKYLHIFAMNNVFPNRFYSNKKYVDIGKYGNEMETIICKFRSFLRNII